MPQSRKKVPFNKSPSSFDDQVIQLKNRGMIIDDDHRASHYLSHLNYYRLSAYWLPFELDHKTHRFKPNTRFETVLNSYVFDRELRLLLMDAIERTEVSLRTQIAYHLSHRYGPHPHLQPAIFHNPLIYGRSINQLENEVRRSKEKFIRHLRNKYEELMPPIWTVVELMTLGQLSIWFDNLEERGVRQKIARIYGIDEKILRSFFHHLSTIRNLCAHHARVWNREFVFTYRLPGRVDRKLVTGFNKLEIANRKLYNTLVMLEYLMEIISPGTRWKNRLIEMIDSHGIDARSMGFPDGWRALEIWQ